MMRTSRRHFPIVTLLAASLALICSTEPLTNLLQLDRAVTFRRPWTILTCQLTHWSVNHLAWDLALLIVLGIVCERMSRMRTLLAIGLAAIGVPVGILIACPEIQWFRGLSGIDSALFGLLLCNAFITARREREPMLAVLTITGFIAFAAKCVFEQATGKAVFVEGEQAFAVVPAAHVIGFIAGFITVASPIGRCQNRSS